LQTLSLAAGAPAILSYSDQSYWASCPVITRNLARAYALLYPAESFFQIGRDLNLIEIDRLADQIFAFAPDRLIFIDDQVPHPAPLLRAIKARYRDSMPPVYFHVYGDFSVQAQTWLELEDCLRSVPLTLACASPRQARFVRQMLREGQDVTPVIPFPLDPKEFSFVPQLRDRARKTFGINEGDKLIVYTGRITLQKNVLRLIREFGRLADGGRTHLFLAGHFDSRGGPFAHLPSAQGWYYQEFLKCLEELPERRRTQVRYLGQLNQEELLALYSAADLYASLSTFHDDDYGMSPAEALLTGCPALLSDWGGYSGFNIDQDSVTLIPAEIDSVGLHLSSTKIQAGLRETLGRGESVDMRMQRSLNFQRHFSIHGVSERLVEMHRRPAIPFAGFSADMQTLADRIRRINNLEPAFPDGTARDSVYHHLYREYMIRP